MPRRWAAAALLMTVAACSGTSDVDGPATPSTAMDAADTSVVEGPATPSTAMDAAGTSAGARWDPNAWVPTVRVTPVVYSDMEREQHWNEMVVRYAAESGLDSPPPVHLVTWTETPRENSTLVARCLQEHGFPAIADPLGGVAFDPGVPEAQDEALNQALYICNLQYPLDPAKTLDWSEDQLHLVYDYWDEYYIPCMEAHGHPVDTTNRPSREAFIGAFHTSERYDWWPSEGFQNLPRADQEKLIGTCPPYPPDAAMYGS